MVRIDLDNTHSVGLGDNICLLSALANIPDQIDLYVTNNHNTYSRLTHYKKIFNIPDDNLRILLSGVNGTFSNTGWPLNLFKEYYQPDYVNVHNHQVLVKHNKPKHVIAIAGFFENIPANDDNKWPWCKQRPLEYWAKIFLWLKSMDYEVVTVDRHFFDLEDKIDLLVNQCSAIISYEGGMAHLSHVLRIPCFLIDWKLPSPSTVFSDFHCEFVHKTSNVYIVRNDDELFEWDRTQFETHINHLKCGKTNNRLANGEVDIVLEHNSIHGNIQVVDKSKNVLLRAPGIFGENNVAGKFFSKYYTKF